MTRVFCLRAHNLRKNTVTVNFCLALRADLYLLKLNIIADFRYFLLYSVWEITAYEALEVVMDSAYLLISRRK